MRGEKFSLKTFGALVAIALASPGAAQVVGECDGWQASARNVDWSDPTRTFGNGAIRLIALDTTEPAAASFHVMVTYPDPDEMFLDCRLVSAAPGLGFGGLSLRDARAKYDPAQGLSVFIPGTELNGGPVQIAFTVNRATGEVTIR